MMSLKWLAMFCLLPCCALRRAMPGFRPRPAGWPTRPGHGQGSS